MAKGVDSLKKGPGRARVGGPQVKGPKSKHGTGHQMLGHVPVSEGKMHAAGGKMKHSFAPAPEMIHGAGMGHHDAKKAHKHAAGK